MRGDRTQPGKWTGAASSSPTYWPLLRHFSSWLAWTAPLPAPVLTVYTKGDLVSAQPSGRARGGCATDGRGDDRRQGSSSSSESDSRPVCPSGSSSSTRKTSGRSPRFFVVEYLREAAFELLEMRCPIFTAEVEEFREAERPIYIRVTLFVERESQKGIVIGRTGATIKALGSPRPRAAGRVAGERRSIWTAG